MAKKKEPAKRGETLGGMYRAASTGLVVAAPAIQTFLPGQPGGARIGTDIITDIKDAYLRDGWKLAGGVVVHVADNLLGQKVFNHNSALGRGSVTAWLGEAAAVVPAAAAGFASGNGAGAVADFTEAKTGYRPGLGGAQGSFGLANNTKFYLGAKFGLGLVRKLSNVRVFQSVAKPLKRGLGAMGGAL